MGQPACHMPSKATISVVGAADCGVLRNAGSHQDALEPLTCGHPSQAILGLRLLPAPQDVHTAVALSQACNKFITVASISQMGKLRLGDPGSLA